MRFFNLADVKIDVWEEPDGFWNSNKVSKPEGKDMFTVTVTEMSEHNAKVRDKYWK